MLTNRPGTTSNYVAETLIFAHVFVTLGAESAAIKLSTNATDPAIGVSTDVESEAGERCDVILTGQVPVRYGDTVAKGDALTSDAEGRAKKASGEDKVYGVALLDGVQGDFGSVDLTAKGA